MGARAQVIIRNTEYSENEGIALYTHYGSGSLPRDVARALDRGRGRWGDTAYLTRIIFSELIKDDVLGETGFGIEPGRNVHGDLDYPPIIVDDDLGNVTHGGITVTYEEFIAMQLAGAARQR